MAGAARTAGGLAELFRARPLAEALSACDDLLNVYIQAIFIWNDQLFVIF